jgi:hypothetical protein
MKGMLLIRIMMDREDEDEYEEDTPNRQPPTRGHQPSGMSPPMNYLRHPGGNPIQRKGKEDDKWTDIDCMRSPYSVD